MQIQRYVDEREVSKITGRALPTRLFHGEP